MHPLSSSLSLAPWSCLISLSSLATVVRVFIDRAVITSEFGSSMFRDECGFVTLWLVGRLDFVEEPNADVMIVVKKHTGHWHT